MTTYTELTEKAADQLLSAVKPVGDLTRSLADRAAGTVGKLPSLPRPEGVPTTLEVVSANVAFAERLLGAQKDFLVSLAGTTTAAEPTKPAAKASTKTSSKA